MQCLRYDKIVLTIRELRELLLSHYCSTIALKVSLISFKSRFRYMNFSQDC